jgi:hypothetical protein
MAIQQAYDDQVVAELAQDLSEQIILIDPTVVVRVSGMGVYEDMARKLYAAGWRKAKEPDAASAMIDRLLRALRHSWSQDTSGFPGRWTIENPACGQCSVSALVVQDYLGGEIQRFIVVDAGQDMRHVANLLPGGVLLDATASQFSSVPVYVPRANESRFNALDHENTVDRYEILARRVANLMEGA